MISTRTLLERAALRGSERRDLVSELASRGVETANEILERLEQTNRLLAPWNRDLLLATADASLLPRALAMLATMPSVAGVTAYPLIGEIGDGSVVKPLVDHVADENLRPTFRVLAAEALARIRDSEARDPLRTVMSRWQDVDQLLARAVAESAYSLLAPLAVAVTLAALGDQEYAPIVFQIASASKAVLRKLREVDSVYSIICDSLGHLAGAGLVQACRNLASFVPNETKEGLALVLARIGTRSALELLVGLTQSRRSTTAAVASGWLYNAGGAPLVDEDYASEAEKWWQQTGAQFDPNTVYLGGRPWTVESFLAKVRKCEQSDGNDELFAVAGIDVGREMRRRKLDRDGLLAALEHELPGQFVPGKLYRHGIMFEPPTD